MTRASRESGEDKEARQENGFIRSLLEVKFLFLFFLKLLGIPFQVHVELLTEGGEGRNTGRGAMAQPGMGCGILSLPSWTVLIIPFVLKM